MATEARFLPGEATGDSLGCDWTDSADRLIVVHRRVDQPSSSCHSDALTTLLTPLGNVTTKAAPQVLAPKRSMQFECTQMTKPRAVTRGWYTNALWLYRKAKGTVMYRQEDRVSLREILALSVWVVVVLSALALVLAMIMHYLPEGILRLWSAIFASVVGAVIALLPVISRLRRGQ